MQTQDRVYAAAAARICDNVLTVGGSDAEGVVRESEAVSQARRGLGAELAAYRRAAGYSQAELAALTDFSRSTVANVETGRQNVPRDFWERADGALKTGGLLARAADEVEAGARRERRIAARNLSKARQARGWLPDSAELVSASAEAGGADGATDASQAAFESQLLAEADPAAATELVPDAHRAGPPGFHPPGDVLAGTEARPRYPTPGDVTRLRGVRQHLKAIDNAHGGGVALPLTDWYLRSEVAPLLIGAGTRGSCRELVEVAAEFHHDAGWAAYDAAQQQQATKYFAAGLRLANAARERLLSGRILAALSHQAIYLGHVRQAIDFAAAARAATRHIATPRTIAMLAAMQACSYAAAGETRQCRLALDEAASALTMRGDGQPEPEWMDFDEGGYWGHAARAYRDLGQYGEAERCARKSVGLCLSGHGRTRAQRTAIYATAYLRLGEIDAAAAAGEQLVHDAWNLHSSHVFGEVAQLRAALDRFDALVAADFLDQARELLAARAPELDHTAS
jgi:transcriptional regulator with XRE-family HTH domain